MRLLTELELNSLEDLFIIQIEQLYDAELRIFKALHDMVDAATTPSLKQTFQAHLDQTRHHVERLKQIFQQLGRSPEGETCKAMKGLRTEGKEVLSAKAVPEVRDAALIATAQREEHYEIAGYDTARTFAHQLGYTDAACLLQSTLDEEKSTIDKLTEMAESQVNLRTLP